jgi:hypothetical protein
MSTSLFAIIAFLARRQTSLNRRVFMPVDNEQFDILLARLDRIETVVSDLARQRATKDWYEIEEAAALLGRAPFTVREWCRQGRVNAEKKNSGRGPYQSWVISNAELSRIGREGLLPFKH